MVRRSFLVCGHELYGHALGGVLLGFSFSWASLPASWTLPVKTHIATRPTLWPLAHWFHAEMLARTSKTQVMSDTELRVLLVLPNLCIGGSQEAVRTLAKYLVASDRCMPVVCALFDG
jgi:hypothetical protein